MVRLHHRLLLNLLPRLFWCFIHSSFIPAIPRPVSHVHTERPHHREDNEEGGILTLFLRDSGHHTGQAPGTRRLLAHNPQSCRRLSDPIPRPQECVLQAFPILEGPGLFNPLTLVWYSTSILL